MCQLVIKSELELFFELVNLANLSRTSLTNKRLSESVANFPTKNLLHDGSKL